MYICKIIRLFKAYIEPVILILNAYLQTKESKEK